MSSADAAAGAFVTDLDHEGLRALGHDVHRTGVYRRRDAGRVGQAVDVVGDRCVVVPVAAILGGYAPVVELGLEACDVGIAVLGELYRGAELEGAERLAVHRSGIRLVADEFDAHAPGVGVGPACVVVDDAGSEAV